jgi:hypothetical protein
VTVRWTGRGQAERVVENHLTKGVSMLRAVILGIASLAAAALLALPVLAAPNA